MICDGLGRQAPERGSHSLVWTWRQQAPAAVGLWLMDGSDMQSLVSSPVGNLTYTQGHRGASPRGGMRDLSGTVETVDAGKDRGAIAWDPPGLSSHRYRMFVSCV